MNRNRILLGVLFAALFSNAPASAGETTTLKEVVVKAVPHVSGAQALADVEGAKVYAGKKTTVVATESAPPVQNNNYRQAFSQVPGLLVSEQNNHGHVNVNYRGIGDPHESQDLLTLKDGLPIGIERYGYSTTYFTPPMEAVERIEFVRGGSALLYGPQPGPALNYVTFMPPADREFTLSSQHVFGSDDLYTTYNSLGGTVNGLGYLGMFHHGQSDGMRANEDHEISGGSLKLAWGAGTDTRWILALDVHEKESGEPGRLTLAQYQADRFQTLRPFDRLETERYAGQLTLERDLSEDTLWATTLFGGYFDRFSLRRTTNTSNQNNLDRREVYSGGVESRLKKEYQAFGDTHTLAAGVLLYGSDAPRTQHRSARYPSRDGAAIFDFDYETYSGAFFAENQFNFGRLAIIPAFRFEQIEMNVTENFNTAKTSPLHAMDESFSVPLFGIGGRYALNTDNELYANASQGFKPPQFDDLAPSGNNTLPSTTLEEGRTWTTEGGVRGKLFPWLSYDATGFLTDYENYFGTVTVGTQTQRQNVGDVEYYGAELSGELDVVRWLDDVRQSELAQGWGSISLYASASLLSAEFTGGPLTGKEPAYAPDSVVKTGVIYRMPKSRGKVALLGTFVDDHFWADNNLPGGVGLNAVPSYQVWDLTGELVVHPNVNVIFGVSNLFDETYFSRVRSDGIEPAAERSYYGGAKVVW